DKSITNFIDIIKVAKSQHKKLENNVIKQCGRSPIPKSLQAGMISIFIPCVIISTAVPKSPPLSVLAKIADRCNIVLKSPETTIVKKEQNNIIGSWSMNITHPRPQKSNRTRQWYINSIFQ